jgi:hypothetical protein
LTIRLQSERKEVSDNEVLLIFVAVGINVAVVLDLSKPDSN